MTCLFAKFKKILRVKFKWLIHLSVVNIDSTSTINVGRNVRITNSKIHATNDSKIVIEDNVVIKDTIISVDHGNLFIGKQSQIENGRMPWKASITITHGDINIGQYNRLRMDRFWVRFGGKLTTGNYVNINEFSEIRADECIQIGDFVEISYYVMIWDTNTHEFESIIDRRTRWMAELTHRDVSVKPKTKPILISNDIWIGRGCYILKGSTIGNGVILGCNTMISNKDIKDNQTVVSRNDVVSLHNKF